MVDPEDAIKLAKGIHSFGDRMCLITSEFVPMHHNPAKQRKKAILHVNQK